MAKKASKPTNGDGNKSQAIRDYVAANPTAGPTSVAQALNEREGWKISAAYVSTIKNKSKGGKGRRARKAGRRAGRPMGGGGGGQVSEQALLQVKKMAEQIGSISEAKAALDLLSKLTT